MRFGRLVGMAALMLAAAAAYGIYAPDEGDRWAPPVSGIAHKLHARLFATPSKTATASSSGAPGSAASTPGQSAGPAPIAVSVTAVRRADFPIVLEGLGQVQAYNTVLVRARVDGQIVKIAFKEGQMVKEGDLLAEIDPRPFQAALDQASPKKTQDEANLANAKLDLTAIRRSPSRTSPPSSSSTPRTPLVNQLTASIAADAAAIDAAKVQLDYTTIRAPISGRAGFRLIDEGNLVNAAQQTGIVTIAQLQPIAVIFTEPQEYVDRINQDLAAGAPEVTVTNTEGEKLATGKLTISDNQVDPTTGTIRLKAEFENKDNALWPGLAVTTGLTLGRRQGRLARADGRGPAWTERPLTSMSSTTRTAPRSGR